VLAAVIDLLFTVGLGLELRIQQNGIRRNGVQLAHWWLHDKTTIQTGGTVYIHKK